MAMGRKKLTIIQLARKLLLGLLHRVEISSRRIRQKSRLFRAPHSNLTFHVLCIRRREYINAVQKCANSVWEFMPGARFIVWTDSQCFHEIKRKKGFDRKSDVIVNLLPESDEPWQLMKLRIILEHVEGEHVFVDSDLIWNGELYLPENPMFFVNEFLMSDFTKFKYLLHLLKLDLTKSWYLLNVSLVAFPKQYKTEGFKARCLELFDQVSSTKEDNILGRGDAKSLVRLSEQIALSIAVQEIGAFSVLKKSDSIMDGGVAESYYLGSTRGWD